MSADESRTLERVEGKIDFIIEALHRHELRFVPLEANLSQRQDRTKSRTKVVYGVVTAVVAAFALAFFGLHK